MPTIKYKPTTPARRHMSVPSFDEITKFTPEKSLLATKKKNAGRNSYGRITVRHKGGGNRQKYRIIDFKRQSEKPYRVYRTAEGRGRQEELHRRSRGRDRWSGSLLR